ncbi:MAG: OmpA family protein [Pseudomonadota bacterium]|nr:OmpA family protein [Pseudomonadota bacterium]
MAALLPTLAAADGAVVELGTKVPSVADVRAGLFPDASCEELKAQGFRCMGFKPPVKFSLPAASFRRGSAELPAGIKRQLDVFAAAMTGKTPTRQVVRIEGHADASGNTDVNLALSQKRAEAAKSYLVSKGVSPDLVKPVGVGSAELIDSKEPLSPRNRRVVIGRDQVPEAPTDGEQTPAAPANLKAQ